MSFLWHRSRATSPVGSVQSSRFQTQHDGDEIQELRNDVDLAALSPHIQGPTLLPGPVAKIVSGATGLGSFYVRASTKLGAWGVSAGREATLKSLEMSRAMVETVLLAAGRDVSARSGGDLGRADAENILERSISTLHTAISTISFATSFGFQSTQTIIDSLSSLSIQGLSTLNAVLGSTESSRAVAAIITLIRDELNKPDETTGEVASYLDLLVGTIAFVLLQRWGRRQTELELRDSGVEELIWDTVIDDKGFRADVVATNKKGMVTATKKVVRARAGSDAHGADDLISERGFEFGQQAINLTAEDQTTLSDEEIRQRIMSQLPPGTRATITTETMTLKKVTVEIHEGETANIEAPPGLVMISESLSHNEHGGTEELPQQTIVFRTTLTRSSSAEISPYEKLRITSTGDEVVEQGDDEGLVMINSASPQRGSSSLHESFASAPEAWETRKPLPSLPVDDPSPLANVKRSRRPIIHPDSDPARTGSSPGEKSNRESSRTDAGGVIMKALRTLSPRNSLADLRQSIPSITLRRQTAPIEPMSPISRRSSQDLVTGKRNHPSVAATHQSSPAYASLRRDHSSSYFTMHEKKRESVVSQTDTYSIHSTESRPTSPTYFKTHARTSSGISKAKSQTEISLQSNMNGLSQDRERHHSRANSHVPSLYSMATRNSEEAIILAPRTLAHKSIFEDHKMLTALATDGIVPGMFPKQHFVRIVRRFARFATASYGNNFLRMMGLWASPEVAASIPTDLINSAIHHEHNSFSTHTGLPADCILLSSFFDANGATGAANTTSAVISPLVHFVSADHDQKAIVLTCRGTLGFEDVLTDMVFDYDELRWQGQTYHVHKGIHAAARRLLSPLGNRVMSCIKRYLEIYPEYGLVLCGHSLGGAVAALLAILLSEPSQSDSADTAFVTAKMAKLLTYSANIPSSPFVGLPAGRPIHAYAFGSPAIVSSALRLATRGLVTTVVNSNDVVPTLSLGTLHDTRRVAVHLKQDANGQLMQLRSRVLTRVRDSLFASLRADGKDKGPPAPENIAGDGPGEDTWAWKELESIRSCMSSEKLFPPGECFIIETSRVYDRVDPHEAGSVDELAEARYFQALGRPATRVQFKLVRDVERRFGEVKFGSHMFGDHSPGRYEAALSALEKGICDG